MLRFLIDTIEFVYNNYITISILIGASAFFVFNSKQLYMEVSFNRLLRMKQKFLRNSSVVQSKSKKIKRLSFILAPMVLLIIFLTVTFANPTVFDQHVTYANSEQDIMNIRDNFDSKFYSNPIAQDEHVVPTSRNLRESNIQATEQFTGIDFVTQDEKYIYTLTNNYIYIANYADYESITVEHVIALPLAPCEAESFKPEGLIIDGGRLSVIGQQAVSACDNNEVIAFHQREHKTFVFSYDRFNDFVSTDTYEISGILTQMHYANNNLTLSVNQYIPHESSVDTLINVRPKITVNGVDYVNDYDNIRYIEGTNPNTLVSSYVLRLDQTEFSRETILTDYKHRVFIENNALYYVTDSYDFHPVSDLFESRDPIRNVRTVVTKMNIQNRRVLYYRSSIIEGIIPFDHAITIHSNNVIVLTEKREDSNNYILHRLDRYLGKSHETELLDRPYLETVVYYNDHAYLLHNNQNVEVYFIADSARFYRQHTIENMRMSRRLFAFNNESAIGIYPTEENSLDFQNVDISIPAFPAISQNFRVDFNDYGYNLISSRFKIADMLIIPEDDLMGIPLYAYGNPSDMTNPSAHILFLTLDDNVLSASDTLRLPIKTYSLTPFAYRHVSIDGYLLHITTSGIAVTESNDRAELVEFIDFES